MIIHIYRLIIHDYRLVFPALTSRFAAALIREYALVENDIHAFRCGTLPITKVFVDGLNLPSLGYSGRTANEKVQAHALSPTSARRCDQKLKSGIMWPSIKSEAALNGDSTCKTTV